MLWLWLVFILFVLAMLALDLGVFHRRAHAVSMKESLAWCGVWVSLALGFCVVVYFLYEYQPFGLDFGPNRPRGHEAALLFLTGYVVEESLSMDNMFVIALVFAYFAVPAAFQHRVLFWGILGALVMRAAMILGGTALVRQFQWVLYIFGAFLIVSAIRVLLAEEEADPSKNLIVRLARRVMPVTHEFVGHHFLVRRDGRSMLTPLALALVAVESADVVFALDSIPAIFAITDIPFLIFTSNVFAILGLRSLYFALAGVMRRFHYMKLSLVVLLIVIGVKMLAKDLLHDVPNLTYWTLGTIVLILGGGVVASLVRGVRIKNSKTAESKE